MFMFMYSEIFEGRLTLCLKQLDEHYIFWQKQKGTIP